jgi:Zn ribbon nucleic-acid-binding protein
MICPKCKSKMTIGVSHDDRGIYQWECHHCGYIKVIYEDGQLSDYDQEEIDESQI